MVEVLELGLVEVLDLLKLLVEKGVNEFVLSGNDVDDVVPVLVLLPFDYFLSFFDVQVPREL